MKRRAFQVLLLFKGSYDLKKRESENEK